jgi:acetolactate synthase I/II/III large subunit
MKASDYIAEFFVKKGVDTVFMVTGGAAMHLNDGFARHNSLTIIYNHHEQASALAADGYARVTGKPALVNVTSGPGGINAMTGVHGAYTDSIPMIIISGQVKSETIASLNAPLSRQLGDQEVDITEIVKSITKYSVLVTDPQELPNQLEKAYKMTTSGRPGPVWLDIPIDVQAARIKLKDVTFENYKVNIPVGINEDIIQALVAKIKTAKRPVVFVGNGARVSNCYTELLSFIEFLGFPVLTGWNAHDMLPDSHWLNTGRPGTVGTRAGNINLQKADFLLVLGSRLNIRQISYNYENFAKNAFIAMVDVDENELKKPTLNVDLPIHSDLKLFLKKITKLLISFTPSVDQQSFLEICKQTQSSLADYEVYKSDDSLINPYLFLKNLTELLPEDATIVCGNGAACVMTFQVAIIKNRTRLFTNSGCAPMGYDLPAAIGAAVSGKNVVCIAGDGSIMMNIQELQTLRTLNLNLKIIILNNDGYLSIKQTQNNFFADNLHGTCGENGLSLPNFEKIGRAFGIKSITVTKPQELYRLWENLTKPGPILFDIHVDSSQLFVPKLSSKILDDGTMKSPTLEDMYPFMPEVDLKTFLEME